MTSVAPQDISSAPAPSGVYDNKAAPPPDKASYDDPAQPAQPAPVTGQPQAGGAAVVVVPLAEEDYERTDKFSTPKWEYPRKIECPKCNEDITTVVTYKSGNYTNLLCQYFLCTIGFCCLAPVPYCNNAAKDSVHTCPRKECGHEIGVWKRQACRACCKGYNCLLEDDIKNPCGSGGRHRRGRGGRRRY